jgi:hypothetical protein
MILVVLHDPVLLIINNQEFSIINVLNNGSIIKQDGLALLLYFE